MKRLYILKVKTLVFFSRCYKVK